MSTTPSATPPSTPTIHCPVNYLNESWCDIRYKSGCSSTGSISHLHHTVNPEILEKLLYEAQRESLTYLNSNNNHNQDTGLSITESCLVDSIHHNNLDTSTPMLVTFEATSSGILSPIIAKAPTSPISNKSINLAVMADCSQCLSQRMHIASLMEVQLSTERQLNSLRKEFEDQCLSKSPDFMSRSSRSSISSSSISEDQDNDAKRSQMEYMFPSLKRQNSSSATLVTLNANVNSYASGIFNYNNNNNNVNNNADTAADWTRSYWSSRPQKQPPKEWNFVHPNSAMSKLNNKRVDTNDELAEEKSALAKYISCDSISKILFTHMASFIVGATLMFLVLRRHLNLRSSVYMK